MARVNIDILGISELKWTRMGEFNSDDHYSYHFGHGSLRRNGVAIIVNKRGSGRGENERKRNTMVGTGDGNPRIHQRITNK